MIMKEVTDATLWNTFILRHASRSGAFLQSWEWGVFQESLGRRVERWMARPEEGARAEMAAQTVRMPLLLGSHYVYCPRGPVVAGQNFDVSVLIDELRGLGNNAMFFRFDPPVEKTASVVWKGLRSSIAIQPADTLLTDLSQTEEVLLERMHQKTRYNVRLAEKKGVEIEIGAEIGMKEVWQLFADTAHRGVFHLHEREYYDAMLRQVQGVSCRAFVAVARYKKQVLAANIMIDFGTTRTYLHGASSNAERNVMAPYLLHWRLIQDAQKQGIHWYDWWGIAPPGNPHHPWAGVTRFKLGFGGEHVHYPGTFDLVLKPRMYTAYHAARALVRKMR